jgi:hypothetical protein
MFFLGAAAMFVIVTLCAAAFLSRVKSKKERSRRELDRLHKWRIDALEAMCDARNVDFDELEAMCDARNVDFDELTAQITLGFALKPEDES